ncbi:glycoside hydrolase family 25 protein [Mucilaginibacter koreensis]
MKKPAATSVPKRKAPVKKKKKTASTFPWKSLAVAFFLILLSPFYYGYIVKTFVSAWRWVRDIGENPEYRTYRSFNIRIPRRYTIHGIDVSYAQGRINWKKVSTMREDSVHITFAFIKATEGLLKVDPYFKRNWREAPKAGIVCGAYHYFRPRINGKWQARFFMQNVELEKGDLPMVVDVETLDGVAPAAMRKELQAFLTAIEKRTQAKPIIYSGLSFYQDYLKGYFADYQWWLAHYNQPELKVSRTEGWQFWQHSDHARVSGINHRVDFDAFRGDSIAFQQMLIH